MPLSMTCITHYVLVMPLTRARVRPRALVLTARWVVAGCGRGVPEPVPGPGRGRRNPGPGCPGGCACARRTRSGRPGVRPREPRHLRRRRVRSGRPRSLGWAAGPATSGSRPGRAALRPQGRGRGLDLGGRSRHLPTGSQGRGRAVGVVASFGATTRAPEARTGPPGCPQPAGDRDSSLNVDRRSR